METRFSKIRTSGRSAIRLDVNARSGGVKQHEKKVLGGWGATFGGGVFDVL
jgi:hypothetical protein